MKVSHHAPASSAKRGGRQEHRDCAVGMKPRILAFDVGSQEMVYQARFTCANSQSSYLLRIIHGDQVAGTYFIIPSSFDKDEPRISRTFCV